MVSTLPIILTREETAKRLNISLPTLDRLRRRGLVRSIHVSPGRVGIPEEELARYICQRQERWSSAS